MKQLKSKNGNVVLVALLAVFVIATVGIGYWYTRGQRPSNVADKTKGFLYYIDSYTTDELGNDYTSDIVRIRTVGSESEVIYNGPGYFENLKITPNGERLVWELTLDGANNELWVLDLQDLSAKKLVDGGYGYEISRDSNSLLITRPCVDLSQTPSTGLIAAYVESTIQMSTVNIANGDVADLECVTVPTGEYWSPQMGWLGDGDVWYQSGRNKYTIYNSSSKDKKGVDSNLVYLYDEFGPKSTYYVEVVGDKPPLSFKFGSVDDRLEKADAFNIEYMGGGTNSLAQRQLGFDNQNRYLAYDNNCIYLIDLKLSTQSQVLCLDKFDFYPETTGDMFDVTMDSNGNGYLLMDGNLYLYASGSDHLELLNNAENGHYLRELSFFELEN